MKRVFVSLTLAGLTAVALGACAYDPYYDRPYGYGYPPRGYGAPLTRGQIARMNDPYWCNSHPQRCAYFQSIASGAPPPGYNGQAQPGYNGPPPPPPAGYKGPPPNYNGGPPPGYTPPPGYDGPGANGPPQNMQPPPQQQQQQQ
jgi:hypothetical protein